MAMIEVRLRPSGPWRAGHRTGDRERVDAIYHSLQALAQLPGDPMVFPGHWYSAEPSASLSEVKRTNYVYRASNLDQWRMLMGE